MILEVMFNAIRQKKKDIRFGRKLLLLANYMMIFIENPIRLLKKVIRSNDKSSANLLAGRCNKNQWCSLNQQ